MLHKDCNTSVQLKRKTSRGSKGSCRQDELIGGKPPNSDSDSDSYSDSDNSVHRVEEGSNTSTVALRVVGGDE
jgi:hypothetical protein